jgi:molybdopterin/thiamine biosynthesis adenylyltransferase/rhodanese-related sulfurtransferase
MLSVEQQLRYARHLTLPGFGAEGQQRLMESSVLIVGAGGLGSPAALYLAAAGVGRLGIIDDDVVDLTNLQRQILHRTADVGMAKTDSARQTLTERNPEVEVIPIASRFDESNARELVRDYDVVLDAADNFPTRYLVNDAALLEERRVVHGSVYLYEGQATVFAPGVGPCYRCLFPQPPAPGTVPSCAEAGVLGVLPGMIGVLQATEAIKLLTGLGDPLVGRLLSYDALSMTFRTLQVKRRRACALCGDRPSIKEARTIDWQCDLGDPDVLAMDVVSYRKLRAAGEQHILLDVRESREIEAGHIEGHISIPLGQLADRLSELDGRQDELVVCLCQAGIRSRKAADLLRRGGFQRVANLEGGYLAWLVLEASR